MHKVTLQQQPLRRVVPLAIIVVGLILISALVIQQVAAQESRTLKPPFKLIQTDRTTQRPTDILPPLDAPIVMSQTFDSSYQPVTNLAQLGWHELYGQDATSQYTWKYAGTVPFTDTVWSVGRNPSGSPLLKPATDYYTNGMEAVLVYGPLDMSDYAQAVFTMTYWLDTAPGDYVGVAVSTDGSNFTAANTESIADPTLATTRTLTLSLSPYIARQPIVWVAIYLKSDAALPVGRGMFVHEAVLRGVPLSKNYMPILLNGYPPATPTPTPTMTPTPTATPPATPTATPQVAYRYQYTFTNEPNGNNPDFNRWGGDRTTECGSGCSYSQALGTGFGNPGTFFKLWLQGINGKGGAGPRQNGVSLSTATNFEYSADVYVYNGQLDARYGLAFNATSGTFQDDGTPPMDPSVNYYLLEMKIDPTTRTKVGQWQFLRVVNGNRQALTTAANLPISLNQGQWHNLKVVQQGTTLSFYLNGTFVGSTAYDNGWGNDRRRFGLYIDVRASNGEDGPFEYFSDNITVRDLP
jgi:hypothetical protein